MRERAVLAFTGVLRLVFTGVLRPYRMRLHAEVDEGEFERERAGLVCTGAPRLVFTEIPRLVCTGALRPYRIQLHPAGYEGEFVRQRAGLVFTGAPPSPPLATKKGRV